MSKFRGERSRHTQRERERERDTHAERERREGLQAPSSDPMTNTAADISPACLPPSFIFTMRKSAHLSGGVACGSAGPPPFSLPWAGRREMVFRPPAQPILPFLPSHEQGMNE